MKRLVLPRVLAVLFVLTALILVPALAPTPASAQPPACVASGNCIGFPDADSQSGRFINVTRGLSSLGDFGADQGIINVFLIVPGGQTSFTLAIFDGDLGGTWDVVPSAGLPDQIHWHLYPDPSRIGNTTGEIWTADAALMPDNAWFSVTITNVEAARDISTGDFYYHLVADWTTTNSTNEQNNFKVAVEGIPYLPKGSTVGFIGYGPNDPNPARFPPTTYDGSFSFRFLVPQPVTFIDLYDGDMDRSDDSDDANSPNDPPNLGPLTPAPKWPPFQTSDATRNPAEGAYLGAPRDDAVVGSPLRIEPSVIYHVTSPDKSWTVTNGEPSGDREWERFRILLTGQSHADGFAADVTVPSLPAGLYEWRWEGLDGRNTVFISLDYDLYPGPAAIGNTVWRDLNGNGIWDQATEPGIPGVLVNLFRDLNNNGILDDGPTSYLASAITGANGQYKFGDLAPGRYIVAVDASNFLSGGPLFGLNQTTTFTLVAQPGDHYNRASPLAVWLPANMYFVRADFGFGAGGTGTEVADIGNQVWLDANGNGVFEPANGEIGIAGVTVVLKTPSGIVIATQTTNASGQYLFQGLPYGAYVVDVTDANNKLVGLTLTVGPNQAQTVDNTSKPDPFWVSLNGTQGSVLTADFGYRRATSPGTGTPGYWMNHPEAWPVNTITIGGRTYTKAQAITLMRQSTSRDKTYNMFQQLVAAKLNVAIGNQYSCVAATIANADAWMATYPVGSGVAASSPAWVAGSPLHNRLDQYNNGRLCAPPR